MSESLDALQLAGDICQRYQIGALDNFRAGCRAFAAEETLNVAILGRFKAGKSSFLNHLFGQPWLPIGVIPVTTVITEIQYGAREQALVFFRNGSTETVSIERIPEFISENENPGNRKEVARVRIERPELERYRGIRFVDTPGLESVLEHNSEASLEWLPNTGLALVAVGVDPPLSRHDIELIRKLSRYTPNISLLLTKIDVLSEAERLQVQQFVHDQIERQLGRPVPVWPYSIRPGFEPLRAEIESRFLACARAKPGDQHTAILTHKMDSLMRECSGYLTVALRASELEDSECEGLQQRIVGEKEYLDDTRQALRLLARHAIAECRAAFEKLLQPDEVPIRDRLLEELDHEFPRWTRSLRVATERFSEWLDEAATTEMEALSIRRRTEFIEPVRRVSRQLSQALQDFRNRLSDRTLEALGVPLRTSEMEFRVEDPRAPDVRVGKIFDRNWELLSLVIPMWLVRGLLKRHFERKVSDVVFMNLSRLATQWDEIVSASIAAMEKEAIGRVDELILTIEKLIAPASGQTARIQADLSRLEELRARLNGHPI